MARESGRSFGLEEEYLFLDSVTGEPVDHAADVIRGMKDQRELASRELYSSQLESATPVCRTADEALLSLEKFRAEAASVASEHGAVLASTGMPPVGGDEKGTLSPGRRYRQLRENLGETASKQFVNGVHVHVEVPSRDVGVRVLQRLARWAPALLAMSANSPVWCSEPTGFMSWRYISLLSWPLSGWPPAFADSKEYDRSVEQFIRAGALLDKGVVTWMARLSENFPTIELRIADAQPRAQDTVVFGVLVRALVERCLREEERGEAMPEIAPGVLNTSIWLAAREGIEGELIDPTEAVPMPGIDLLKRAVDDAADDLRANGDLELVRRRVDEIRVHGSPAKRQLDAWNRGGIAEVLALQRSTAAGDLAGATETT